MQNAFDEIARALEAYFDGFHEGDVGKLEQIFAPCAHLYSAANGALQDDPMDAVYARVRARTAPAAKRQKRQDRIVTIDLAGPEMALAKVQLAIGPKLFTDHLSLLRLEGRWRIISKTYTYVPIEVEVEPGAVAAE
ncbi:MAG TPA: nuclear transport factor 2 family protein [Geminicoccaceae bacterium]